MSHARAAEPPVCIAEFDAFVEAQPDDGTIWELIDGRIVAMTNPNLRHGQIALNLATGLKSVAEDQGCRVNVAGLGVQQSSDLQGVDKTIPDITVHCGSAVETATWIDDPTLIVEILSLSTMDYDRGSKLYFYKSLRTLQDIVIVYQDQVRVEHYGKDGDEWQMTALTVLDDRLDLRGLPATMTLAAIYARTNLGPR